MKRLSMSIALAWFLCSTAGAGMITGIAEVSGPGLGEVDLLAIVTGQPNNDNYSDPANPNFVFFNEKVFDHTDYIDIVFDVVDTGGTTEYGFVESVFNFAPETWLAYRTEVGFGTGVDFVLADPGAGLDLDTPDRDPTPISNVFASHTHLPAAIHWEDGEMPFGFVDAMFFSMDVPDGITQFTVRETPLIPEPAALTLLGALTVIALRRRLV